MSYSPYVNLFELLFLSKLRKYYKSNIIPVRGIRGCLLQLLRDTVARFVSQIFRQRVLKVGGRESESAGRAGARLTRKEHFSNATQPHLLDQYLTKLRTRDPSEFLRSRKNNQFLEPFMFS